MVFWILFAVIVVLLIIWLLVGVSDFRSWSYHDGGDWFGVIVQFIWKPAVAAVVAFLALGICYSFAQFINDGYHVTKSETYNLQALTTDEDVSGRMFLFVGSFGEHSTISYIRANGEDEGMVIREVGTLNATIYERDEDATMSVHTWHAFSPWLVPNGVAVKGTETYTFTVPVGSVSNQIEVKP